MSDIEGKAARVAASEFQIFADLDQERRHVSETCVLALSEQRIKREAKLAEFVLLNQYFLLRTFF